MYKKIVTVVSMEEPMPQTNCSQARGAMSIYVSSKKVWEGSAHSFNGFIMLDFFNGIDYKPEVRYKTANEEWFVERKFKWPDSLKEVMVNDEVRNHVRSLCG